VVASINPSGTSTPIDDARSAIKSVGDSGVILLPPDNVQEAGTLGGGAGKPLGGIEIKGPAVKPSTPTQGASAEIEFTSSGASSDKGFELDNTDNHGGLTNVIVRGPGQGLTTGPAIDFVGNSRGFDLDGVYITDWSSYGVTNVGGGLPFEGNWGFVQVVRCDDLPLYWANGGAPMQCDYFKLNASGTALLRIDSGDWEISTMNLGGEVAGDFGVGAACRAAILGNNQTLNVGTVNYEPASQTGVNKVWTVRDDGAASFGPLRVSASVDYAYGLNISPGNKEIGPVYNEGATTLSANVVDVQDTPVAACEYHGILADADNNTGGSLSEPDTVYALDGALS
jgi:hypothetical protein